MIGWLQLTAEQRRQALIQAQARSGIAAKAIEKDWWVTLCLKALFQTPYAKYCLFKGGTSLSKAWKLIQRFSEDVDIALAPEAFGMTYQESPSHMYVKNMKRRGCTFTSTILMEALETAFADMGVPQGLVTVEAEEIPHDRPDKDPQTLFIRYPSLFDTHLYLLDEVKMEFGVRSFRDPFAHAHVQSILSEVFPNPAYEETPFEVTVVEPRKTLLEKMFLLHEKFHADRYGPIQLERQSRHPYDIVSMLATPAAAQVLEDLAFYDRLLAHRKNYVRLSGVDYDTLRPRQLRFVPYIETVETFRTDYLAMQQSMIYGEFPTFDDILRQLKYFNGQVRLMGTGLDLQDVIEQFLRAHKTSMDADPKQLRYKDSVIMITSDGESITFQLTFYKPPGGWTFEELKW